MSSMDKLRKKVDELKKDGFVVSSFFTFGKNIDELKSNWSAGMKKGRRFVVVSDSVRDDTQLSESVADENLFNEKIYYHFESAMEKIDFNPSNIMITVTDKITIILFHGLHAKKIVVGEGEKDIVLFKKMGR